MIIVDLEKFFMIYNGTEKEKINHKYFDNWMLAFSERVFYNIFLQ